MDDPVASTSQVQGAGLEDGFGFEGPSDVWLDRAREAEMVESLGCIGPYELVEEVHRGGQGIVYRARQLSTKRDVALKRLLAGSFATQEMRARFQREVETAAGLSHPGIISVFGVEVVDGQPVLAMEWVDGLTIDHRAEQLRGTTDGVRRIIELFIQVCDAVHHAHQRGVIHRDLKPSNILVDTSDRPRLLDFGLAKFTTDSGREDDPVVTVSDGFLGTFHYAAPEQLEQRGAAIDSRTDIYALGICLFELLTGSPPRPASTSPAELLSLIRVGECLSLARVDLARDLKAVITMATAMEPDRRYQSVDALRDDLTRHLNHQPLRARPPGGWYLFSKLLRRHWLTFSVAGVIFGLVVALAISSSVMAVRLKNEQHRTWQSHRRETNARTNAERYNRFLDSILTSAAPRQLGPEATMVDLLGAITARLDTDELANSPIVEARLRRMIAVTWMEMGEWQEAEHHLRTALEFHDTHNEAERMGRSWCMLSLGRILLSRGETECISLLAEGITVIEAAYGPDHRRVAEAKLLLARARYQVADPPDHAAAAQLYQQATTAYRRTHGSDSHEVARCLLLLAQMETDRGNHEAALSSCREAVLIYETNPPPDGSLITRARAMLLQYEERVASG